MKNVKIMIVGASAAVALALSAHAQIDVATGDAKAGSTYAALFAEMKPFCANVGLSEVNTTGSVQNLSLLTENKVSAAFVQTDALFLMKNVDESKVQNIKTLVTLYPEELHFIARGDVKKEGGYLGGLVGGKEVRFNKIEDVANRVVGAVGGSVLSGKIFSSKSGLNFTVQEFQNNDALKEALLAGQVDTILVVGGAPHKLVQSLDTRFKLLPVSPEMQKSVGDVYVSRTNNGPIRLSYPNLNQSGVPTVATQSAIVTRTFRSKEAQAQLAQFRDCFYKAANTLADRPRTRPQWQVVDPDEKGRWVWYDLK
jgi:TRAP-type uncharacterized transport system substrate-binding protein